MTSSFSYRTAASAMAVAKEAVRLAASDAQLTRFLGGSLTWLTERASRHIHLVVYVFEPSAEVHQITLVTAGMSDLPMPVPGSGAQLRMELMLALPRGWPGLDALEGEALAREENFWPLRDRKSTRLNSSHVAISYA